MPGPRRRRSKQQTETYTVPEAGDLLRIGRNQAYAAAKRGEIPTIKIGRSLRVPKLAFNRLLKAAVPRPPSAS
ncbi:MAG: helix-turn-helix domain-containing protein [Stellaceae bacterium]